MKKEYTEPKAEKVEFNYADTVVASGVGVVDAVEVGKNNANACFTGNHNNVNTGCIAVSSKNKNNC